MTVKTKKVRVIRITVPAVRAQAVWAQLCVAMEISRCPDYNIQMDAADVVVPDNHLKVVDPDVADFDN